MFMKQQYMNHVLLQIIIVITTATTSSPVVRLLKGNSENAEANEDLQVFEGSGGCLRSADPLIQQAGNEVSVPVPSLDGAQRGQALLQPPLYLLVCGEALGLVLQADLSRIECLDGCRPSQVNE
jgi:hypothetical protein